MVKVLWSVRLAGKDKELKRYSKSKSNVNTTKSLEGAWWNAKSKKWMCKGTIPNLEKIQKFWSLWAEKERLSKVISSLDMVKKSTIGITDSCIYNIVTTH